MKEFFKKAFGWLLESNRMKHLACGFIIAFSCGLDAGVIAGFAVEYKDWAYQGRPKGLNPFRKGSGWDWWDVLATTIGAILGALLRLICFKKIL